MPRNLKLLSIGLIVLGLVGIGNAASVLITEAPGLPGHPAEWAAVAGAMGHSVTIAPISVLDGIAWAATTDVLIVTDPFYPYTAAHTGNIWDAVNLGVGVYIQGEDDPAFPSNTMFEVMVNTTGFAGFFWVAIIPGMLEASIVGPVAIDPNPIIPLVGMDWAAEGVHLGPMGGCTTNMWVGDAGVGFIHDEITNPFAGLLAINTEFNWILPLTNTGLMENYIQTLLSDDELGATATITPTGPAVIPAAGGGVPYTITLENFRPYGWPTTVWVRAILPSGAVYGVPLAGPSVVGIPPMGTIGPVPSPGFLPPVTVPPFAPAGDYWVQACMTDGFIGWSMAYDSDFFMFTKTPFASASTGEMSELPEDMFGTERSAGSADAMKLESFELASGSNAGIVELPGDFSVSNAYPNPFNPSTSIKVSLASASELNATVYDVQGREVTTLAAGTFSAGTHHLSFDATGLASGVYFLKVTIPGQLNETRKLVLAM
jgi:Secretion system C-terminal sorting domain